MLNRGDLERGTVNGVQKPMLLSARLLGKVQVEPHNSTWRHALFSGLSVGPGDRGGDLVRVSLELDPERPGDS